MGDHGHAKGPAEADNFADIPDAENHAILDARSTFVITMVGAALFCAAVYLFII